jgi:alkylation response protein AidB-like acyl-CoA dehydrogenase
MHAALAREDRRRMQLDFTDEQEELRASIRSVLDKEWSIKAVRGIVEGTDDGSAATLWKTIVGLDWPTLALPEEHGGLGLGFVEVAVVAEEAGRVVAPGPLLPTITQFVPAVRELGTAEQRARFLASVAAGDLAGTLALAEDGRRWLPPAVDATVRENAGAWALTGCKRHVVDPSAADEIAVVARLAGSEGDDGLTVVVVPRGDVEIERLVTIDGSREYATVTVDGVRVSRDRVLGEPGRAARGLARAVEEATVATALEIVGTCQTIFDIALDYAKMREQFGVPIGSFQAVKHKLANMFVALERARSTCYFAALTIAEDDERRTLATSMAKAAAGDCQQLVAQDGIQLLGGIGYTWEHDMHLYVKRAKAAEGLFGAAPAHRSRVADLLGV